MLTAPQKPVTGQTSMGDPKLTKCSTAWGLPQYDVLVTWTSEPQFIMSSGHNTHRVSDAAPDTEFGCGESEYV